MQISLLFQPSRTSHPPVGKSCKNSAIATPNRSCPTWWRGGGSLMWAHLAKKNLKIKKKHYYCICCNFSLFFKRRIQSRDFVRSLNISCASLIISLQGPSTYTEIMAHVDWLTRLAKRNKVRTNLFVLHFRYLQCNSCKHFFFTFLLKKLFLNS